MAGNPSQGATQGLKLDNFSSWFSGGNASPTPAQPSLNPFAPSNPTPQAPPLNAYKSADYDRSRVPEPVQPSGPVMLPEQWSQRGGIYSYRPQQMADPWGFGSYLQSFTPRASARGTVPFSNPTPVPPDPGVALRQQLAEEQGWFTPPPTMSPAPQPQATGATTLGGLASIAPPSMRDRTY